MKIIHSVVDFHPCSGYISTTMQRRYIIQKLLDALFDTPVVLVNGARQTGKSTLVRDLLGSAFQANYFTLDDTDILSAASADPAGFVAGLPTPVIIDEIQHAPALFRSIKAAIDRHRKPGQFLLTGSANILLLPQLSESLAGRMEILTLWPLSQGEILGKKENFIDTIFQKNFINNFSSRQSVNVKHIISYILQGGYPEMLTRKTDVRRQAWFKSYLTTILQRDIREIANIEGLVDLPNLLKLLASRIATLLNYAEISRITTFPQTTLKRYMTLLQTTFLIYLLPAWSTNLSNRVVKSPKLMLNDTGLATYLLGMSEKKLQEDHHLLGPLFENFVVNELHKQATWSEINIQLFHFRSQIGQEVDIILEKNDRQIIGIEIKAKTHLTQADFKGLRALADIADKKLHAGIIFYLGNTIFPFGKNLYTLPINLLWAG